METTTISKKPPSEARSKSLEIIQKQELETRLKNNRLVQ